MGRSRTALMTRESSVPERHVACLIRGRTREKSSGFWAPCRFAHLLARLVRRVVLCAVSCLWPARPPGYVCEYGLGLDVYVFQWAHRQVCAAVWVGADASVLAKTIMPCHASPPLTQHAQHAFTMQRGKLQCRGRPTNHQPHRARAPVYAHRRVLITGQLPDY